MSYQKVTYNNKKEFEEWEKGNIDISKERSSRVWAIYKGGEEVGKTRSDLIQLEARIKEIEKQKGWEPHDFDARWARRGNNPEVDDGSYTLSEAESIIPDEEWEEQKKYLDKAIALKKLSVDYVEKKDPTFKNNPAGSGQVVNMANYERQLAHLLSIVEKVIRNK